MRSAAVAPGPGKAVLRREETVWCKTARGTGMSTGHEYEEMTGEEAC